MQKINFKILFLIFILLLGSMVGYTFYTYWSAGNPNNSVYTPFETSLSKTNKKINDEIILDEIAPIIPNIPLNISVYKDENNSMEKFHENNIVIETTEEIEEKTQKIYSELLPDDYEETIEEANIAFDKLDIHIEEISQQDSQIMEDARELQEINNEEDVFEESEEVLNEKEVEVPIASEEI